MALDDRYGLNLYGQYLYKGIKPDTLAPTDYSQCFLWPPNWGAGVRRKGGYRTVIAATPYAIEQRSPQQDAPLRRLAYTTLCTQSELAELQEQAERLHGQFLWWPMWPEGVGLADVGPLLGLAALTPAEDLSERYDFMAANPPYVMLAHRSDRSVAAVHEVTSIAAALVTLDSAITIALDGEDARLYPAVCGLLESYEIRDATDAIATVDVVLTENRPPKVED